MRSGITYREARTEPLAAVARVVADLRGFRERHELDHVVVLNLCSTEPPAEPHPAHARRRRAPERAAPRPRRAAAQLALRPRGDRGGLRVRRLHALHRRAPARARGARRGARHPARRQRRQDGRDADEVGRRADVRRARPARALLGRLQPARRRRRRGARRSLARAVQDQLQGPDPRRDPRLRRRGAGADRLRPRPRRVEDRVGPHPVRGLPRRADEAPVHLGGLRLRARRAAAARPRAARRARARARRVGLHRASWRSSSRTRRARTSTRWTGSSPMLERWALQEIAA